MAQGRAFQFRCVRLEKLDRIEECDAIFAGHAETKRAIAFKFDKAEARGGRASWLVARDDGLTVHNGRAAKIEQTVKALRSDKARAEREGQEWRRRCEKAVAQNEALAEQLEQQQAAARERAQQFKALAEGGEAAAQKRQADLARRDAANLTRRLELAERGRGELASLLAAEREAAQVAEDAKGAVERRLEEVEAELVAAKLEAVEAGRLRTALRVAEQRGADLEVQHTRWQQEMEDAKTDMAARAAHDGKETADWKRRAEVAEQAAATAEQALGATRAALEAAAVREQKLETALQDSRARARAADDELSACRAQVLRAQDAADAVGEDAAAAQRDTVRAAERVRALEDEVVRVGAEEREARRALAAAEEAIRALDAQARAGAKREQSLQQRVSAAEAHCATVAGEAQHARAAADSLASGKDAAEQVLFATPSFTRAHAR